MLKIVGKLYNHVFIVENCYYIYEFNFFILLQYDVYLMYFWCIHIINLSYIVENFILSDVFILSRYVIPYVFLMYFLMYFWCIHIITTRNSIENSASYVISRITRNSAYYICLHRDRDGSLSMWFRRWVRTPWNDPRRHPGRWVFPRGSKRGWWQPVDQNEDDGSQYLNDTGDGDAETMEDMHVEDDIPELYGIRS